jgi:hypothetical protein
VYFSPCKGLFSIKVCTNPASMGMVLQNLYHFKKLSLCIISDLICLITKELLTCCLNLKGGEGFSTFDPLLPGSGQELIFQSLFENVQRPLISDFPSSPWWLKRFATSFFRGRMIENLKSSNNFISIYFNSRFHSQPAHLEEKPSSMKKMRFLGCG